MKIISGIVLSVLLAIIPYQFVLADCSPPPITGFVLKGSLAIDPKNKLVWNRCPLGMRWSKEDRCSGEPSYLSHDEAIKQAKVYGQGWRLPSGPEMEKLWFHSCKGPKIDTRVFPATTTSDHGEGANFWTASQAMPNMFYYFDFSNRVIDMHSPGFGLSVLIVRDLSHGEGVKK
ncbi:Lcl C-terminal domain-containing protein [Methylovirgula sp. 4M-Z18]|uniref:Lcl C-terminal domain-containing protein n=1 Tax=Methylovirgula sp. 4M-Z18 TaxID=2293567 RepID=UPI000E2FBA51|nr:DUF1566 domain-containing protein [Methylovirgula sp. 4M-Z18]RFB80365.1 DUF1566 domain-containing protein [Methylovirgula sp. 4M-Z18]